MSSASSSLAGVLRGVLLNPAHATSIPVHGRVEAAVLVALYDGFALRSPQAATSDDRFALRSPQAATSDDRFALRSPQAATSGRRHTELHAIFTRRRHDLRSHPGEISFPGGRRDEGEDDLGVTALREAEEEIGLAREEVQLLGALAPVATIVSNYAVYPYVGLIEPGGSWTPSASEVDEVLELRLTDVRASRARRRLMHRGIAFRTDVYDVAEQLVIWGATARIVRDLLQRLGPVLDDATRA